MNRNSVQFIVAITALSLFKSIPLFLRGREKMERDSNGDKKCTEFRLIFFTFFCTTL